MPRRFLRFIWDDQTRREVTFVVTAVVTAVAAPDAGKQAITAAVMFVSVVAYVVLGRGPEGTKQPALLLCAATGIAAILLSHNGIGEWGVLLCAFYTRLVFPELAGKVVTALLALAFAGAVAWISRSPIGILAGIGVPVLAQRRLQQQELENERDRAVRLLAELEAARDAQAEAAALQERGRIAREMHDVLAHSLAGLSLQLQAVRAVAGREGVGPAVTEPLDKAAELARSGVEEAKAVVDALRASGDPAALGIADLAMLVERFPGAAQLTVAAEPKAVSPAVGHAIYRAVQESLTNAARYAPGSEVRVKLWWEADSLRVLITDDGPGGRPVTAGQGSGQGLRGMQERIAAIGGRWRSGPHDAGWQTEIVVPLDVVTPGVRP